MKRSQLWELRLDLAAAPTAIVIGTLAKMGIVRLQRI